MVCNFSNPRVHKVTGINVGSATVELTVTNSTDIGNLENFVLIKWQSITGITGSPLPVTINVNGTVVPLINRFSKQVMANDLPKRSCGVFLESDTYTLDETNEITIPARVMLLSTPKCKCMA